MLKPEFKAAGVSFEGRPQILSQLYADNPWRDITLKLTKYENQDAIVLEDYATKLQIGWVPKSKVTDYMGTRRMAGRIVKGKTNIGVQLFEHKTPSQKQYWTIKRYCDAHNLPMPPYTRAAYESMFAVLRSEQD